MNTNVGGFDRILRLILGLVAISLVFFGPKTNWGWFGLIPLVTAIFNFCPLYIPCKFSTKKEN
jgi:hypothetical protein